MTNDERNPKPECRKTLSGAFAGFVIRISSFLRISSFVIRISEEWFMERAGVSRSLIFGAAEAAQDRGSLLRKDMAGHAASRQRSHGVERVNAALRTRRKRVVLQIRQNVLGAHGVADAFLVLQRPLVFGAFDDSQVVHAGISGGVGLSVGLQLLELLVLGAQPFVFGQQLL